MMAVDFVIEPMPPVVANVLGEEVREDVVDSDRGGRPTVLSQILEVDIRDIVVANSSFGPHEIRQMVDVISSDNLRVSAMMPPLAAA